MIVVHFVFPNMHLIWHAKYGSSMCISWKTSPVVLKTWQIAQEILIYCNCPKSVHNRCVNEVFGGVLCCQVAFDFFFGCRGFCQRTESDPFLSSAQYQWMRYQSFCWKSVLCKMLPCSSKQSYTTFTPFSYHL